MSLAFGGQDFLLLETVLQLELGLRFVILFIRCSLRSFLNTCTIMYVLNTPQVNIDITEQELYPSFQIIKTAMYLPFLVFVIAKQMYRAQAS